MKRTAFFLLVAISMWANQVIPQERAGTVLMGRSLDSHILGGAVAYTVYLPPQYEDSERHYPIVFALHGSGGNENGLLVRQRLNFIADDLIARGKMSPMILVMPDGARTRYLNNHDNSLRYQDFFFSEFVPQIESQYRVEPNKSNRAILGVSMGGYGSLVYALKFPGMFSASVSIGAPICEDEIVLGLSLEQWNKSDRGPVYGLDLAGQDRFTDHYRSNDPCFMVHNVDPELISTAGIYLACGDDDFRKDGNATLHALMRRLSIAHEYRVKDGGHEDEYFQGALADGLIYISEKLVDAQEPAPAEQLIGTWKIVQTVTSNQSGERIDNDPPPGMYMFTGRYMSNLIVPEWEPRPMISRKSSDKERLGAYDNFIADGGEYWIVGDVIQTHNFIAKVPNAMRPERKRGEGIRYKFHFEEDELVITMTQQGWARSGSITYRLERME